MYYLQIRDGLWKTKVIGINPDGQHFTMQSCATFYPPDEQHAIFVGNYRSMGYKVAEQSDSGAVRQSNIDDKLRRLLKDSGLEHLL